ncbi:hypothetical protein AWN65_03345 [Flavobacterium covae]|nr:hypothetical protein AWN65_03345 [Flavobacterium covae]
MIAFFINWLVFKLFTQTYNIFLKNKNKTNNCFNKNLNKKIKQINFNPIFHVFNKKVKFCVKNQPSFFTK